MKKNGSLNYEAISRQRTNSSAHRRRILAQNFLPTPRRTLFGAEAISHPRSLDSLSQPLATVHEYCTGRFWNIPPTEDSIFSKVMKKCAPPVEVHRNITLSEFAQAYDRFRAWLTKIEDAPYSHEFFHVQRLVVKQLETQNIFDVKLSDIDEASLWQPRWVPPLGTILSVRQHGACSLVSVRKVPDMTKYYLYVMSTPLQEIRCRRVWHVVLAFHLHAHASVTSESLAEAVASFLQTLKRRNLNQQISIKKLVWATQLKSIGLQGMGGEEGILSMALNIHFSCKDPSGWHFCAAKTNKNQSLTINASSNATCVC